MSIFPTDFDPTYEDYVTKFLEYEEQGESTLWQRGDLLVEFTYQPSVELLDEKGHRAKSLRALASDVRRHHKTLERWRYTAERFPQQDRILDLPFSLHTAAAYSDKPKFWLKKAANNEWSKHQLVQAIKAAEHPEEAWVSKTLRSSAAELYVAEKAGVEILGEEFKLQFFAKEGDPIRLGLDHLHKTEVEVEASIRIRRRTKQ